MIKLLSFSFFSSCLSIFYIYICTFIYVYVCIYTTMYIHTVAHVKHVCMDICMYTHASSCVFIYIHIHTDMCLYIHIHVCMYSCVCVDIYVNNVTDIENIIFFFTTVSIMFAVYLMIIWGSWVSGQSHLVPLKAVCLSLRLLKDFFFVFGFQQFYYAVPRFSLHLRFLQLLQSLVLRLLSDLENYWSVLFEFCFCLFFSLFLCL